MRKGLKRLLALAGLGAGLLAAATAAAASFAPDEARHRCKPGFRHAVIAGRQQCLKVGERCNRRNDRQYHRYGFHCHSGRLTRRRPPPPPPPPSPSPTTSTGEVPVPGLSRPDAVRSALAALRQANIAFAAPRELGLNEQGEVQLLLSTRQPISELKDQISDLGAKEGASILVSDVMTATLTGLGFSIEEITPTTQVVADAGVTQWRWSVEPTRPGTRRLHLTLSALISVNGSERPYTVRSFERVLPVNVTWSGRLTGFVGKNWQWLWTTLLVPGVLALWGYLRRRRSKEKLTPG